MTRPNYVWPFPTFRAVWWVGGGKGACGLCPGLGAWRARAPCLLGFVLLGCGWVGGGLGLWAVSKVEGSTHVCSSPSGVYPAGGLRWHFACGFNFGNGLWLLFVAAFAVRGERLLMVPVGAMGPFWPGDSLFRALCVCVCVCVCVCMCVCVCVCWLVGCVQSKYVYLTDYLRNRKIVKK